MPLKTTRGDAGGPTRGRGAPSNVEGRFEAFRREAADDGWAREEEDPPRALHTIVTPERAKSIIARNESPDVGFDRSINPYRGCEHGCAYCFARPTHAYLGLSPGLDFETRIFAKTNAAELLRAELAAPGYRAAPIAIGVNTDAYQPVERELKLTRSVLQVLVEHEHPFFLITKNALIERDIDLLSAAAAKGLARAAVSVTNLDAELARKLEPRASAPYRRLEAIRRLAAAGIETTVMVAPVIPFVTDRDLETILERAKDAGASAAAYVLLRLPHEVAPLFKAWLATHVPMKAEHVMSLVRQMRDGRDYQSAFGVRQRGTGLFADLIAQRFAAACRRLGLGADDRGALDASRFRPPAPPRADDAQLDLF